MAGEAITTEELDLLRDEAEVWHPDRCDIYRVSRVDDPYGGSEDTEAVHLTSVSCSIESGAAQEQLMVLNAAQIDSQIFTVFLPAETDVRVGDHLIITSQSNLHLLVQAVMDPESFEVERRVIASEEGEHLL